MRTDDPEVHNRTRLQHALLDPLHPDYTYRFALISLNPHRANLPERASVPLSFLLLLQQQIMNGPAPRPVWNNSADHLLKHAPERTQLQHVHLQLLACARQALTALRSHNDSAPLQAAEAMIAARQNLVQHDAIQAYLLFPDSVLTAYFQVALAFTVTHESRFGDMRRCFHMVLLYPRREASSLNINVTFKGHTEQRGTRVTYTALAGYCLGQSEAFGNAGRPRNAVYLSDRTVVTTVFGDHVVSLTEPFRNGLMTRLYPESSP